MAETHQCPSCRLLAEQVAVLTAQLDVTSAALLDYHHRAAAATETRLQRVHERNQALHGVIVSREFSTATDGWPAIYTLFEGLHPDLLPRRISVRALRKSYFGWLRRRTDGERARENTDFEPVSTPNLSTDQAPRGTMTS